MSMWNAVARGRSGMIAVLVLVMAVAGLSGCAEFAGFTGASGTAGAAGAAGTAGTARPAGKPGERSAPMLATPRAPGNGPGSTAGAGTGAGVGGAAAGSVGPAAGAPAKDAARPGLSADTNRLRFVVSFPDKARGGPVSGRILLFLSQRAGAEPRRMDYFRLPAVYGINVTNLLPNDLTVFLPEKFRSAAALAFPEPLDRLAPGTYYAQALIDLDDTRADFNSGPGNLYSGVVRCELNGSRGGTYELVADQVVQESVPMDTDWVKLVEVRSKLLSEFHGREVRLRAAVILPSTYHERPQEKFPAFYLVPGFGGRHTSAWGWMQSSAGKRWQKGEVPLQMFRIVLDPDVPLGHSVFANSANNGPVGDALVRELIPEIERRFRVIPEARARFVGGHSSGGWSSLWLQVSYSDLFGGCWSTAPDPVDFRSFQTVNIYEDRNGHWSRDGWPKAVARSRTDVALTFSKLDLWEHVTGPGGQLDSFNAVFSPRGTNGRPRRLMDPLSGVIDREVAEYWKRYDIRRLLQDNWSTLGPELRGKIHVLAADEDTFYLDGAVELLRDFLKTTSHGGYVEIVPGDHGSMMTEELRERIEREVAEKFADRAGEKPAEKPARSAGTK